MRHSLNNSSTLTQDNTTSGQVTLSLLGFDRPGFTDDVLNAVRLDGRTRFQQLHLEADGVRSAGQIQLQIDQPETVEFVVQRLRAIAGLVTVTSNYL